MESEEEDYEMDMQYNDFWTMVIVFIFSINNQFNYFVFFKLFDIINYFFALLIIYILLVQILIK